MWSCEAPSLKSLEKVELKALIRKFTRQTYEMVIKH